MGLVCLIGNMMLYYGNTNIEGDALHLLYSEIELIPPGLEFSRLLVEGIFWDRITPVLSSPMPL